CCTVPARTPLDIEIADAVGSRRSTNGQTFAIVLAEDLVVDGRVVVRAGARGVGEVVHAARAGMGGRAGELILAARYLEVDGQRIPLRTMRYGRSQGADSSSAVNVGNMVAAATVPGLAVVGLFIRGGEIDIPAGTRANAQTATQVHLRPIAD
ncbi:MAG: hypothetical protein M3177_04985, partial [Pseudomonadota bacterium]|nr:hypothetical protein [Pseudomonadota bacterium]